MSPDDLNFLIAVGIRALVEECWKRNVLLLGITKDCSSRYLSKNYLGVMRNIGKYDFSDILLPWTDRTFLEVLPFYDDDLNAPWSTIEFDSTFMTLNFGRENENEEPRLRGVRGDVITTERLFAKSLAQFYLNRSKNRVLSGHMVFIDRLLIPNVDKNNQKVNVYGDRIGKIAPIAFLDKSTENEVQDVSVFLLDILTKNLYPEVIGYPDPLHKADWGAKSILKKVEPMIGSSDMFLRSAPFIKTLREMRDERRRT